MRDIKNYRKWRKRWEANLRQRSLAVLGGQCCKCGYTGVALQIDHVAGGGTEQRRTIYTWGIYRRIVDGTSAPGEYQLLCANCNWEKRFARGEHGTGNCQPQHTWRKRKAHVR